MELSFHSIGKNNHTLPSLVIKVTQFCLLRRSHFLSDELHLVIISVKIPVGIPLLKFFPHSSPFCLNYLWHPTPVLLPGKSHGRRSLEGCSPWGCEESDRTERLHFHFSLSCTGEGNGNPLQCSCLENPREWGAWWAAVYGVTQSRTRLKRLSSSSSLLEKHPTSLETSHLFFWLQIFAFTQHCISISRAERGNCGNYKNLDSSPCLQS